MNSIDEQQFLFVEKLSFKMNIKYGGRNKGHDVLNDLEFLLWQKFLLENSKTPHPLYIINVIVWR